MCVCVSGEDWLRLSVSDSFRSAWITRQWWKWVEMWAGWRFPADSFVASLATQRARQRSASASAAPASGADLALPEHSVSTPALVALLVRWCATLKAPQSTRAEELLASLLATTPSCSWHVATLDDLGPSEHCWPAPPGCAIVVPIVAGGIFPKALMAKSAAHARDLARTLGLQNGSNS